ncbi:MAG: hypothetical protein UT19_C0016G0018 [Candidatus Woesebacteria bacterium GW2011_GWB1_39_10b]|uniref:HTH merR-type domain-containing protein n=1 Tax=Candidatus Woesebacteria bacterium GW2011_GWB1_39_10b TaxID=1618573 RepID=A0A0G0LYX2_9BACT|nr:MAG: hypothetical protein UT19_C0016G0018 [Candidatus Woesebacteria bacterium GW2011_GWB1_39_10b]
MPNNTLLNINEAANILGVSTKTLRRWEEREILKPQRTKGGHRRYLLQELYIFKRQKGRRRISKSLIEKEKIEPSQSLQKSRFENILLPETRIDIEDFEFKNVEDLTPTPYQAIPKPGKIIFKLSLAVSILLLLSFSTFRLLPNNIKLFLGTNEVAQKFQSLIQKKDAGEIEKLKEELVKQEISKVLAATSFTNVSFNVNVPSNFSEDATFAANIAANGGTLTTTSASFDLLNTTVTTLNIGGDATTLSLGASTGTTSINNTLNLGGNTLISPEDITIDPGGGGVKIGTGTQSTIDLTGDDLYVSGDLELDGSLVVGSDSVNDLTGTGLQVSSGSLQATLGTSIESSEISDSTIQEVDLNVSNAASNAYVLTYNSSTGGFTWAVDQTGGDSAWTDSGTTIYLTDTGDELVLGGSTPLSSAKFSIDGDSDQIQLLLQGNSTQTSNIFVIESSTGSDIFSVGGDGLATWTRTSAGPWISFNDGTDAWGLYNRAGTPEGFITANTGTLAMDTANGTLYVKTDDGDATDWVNLATGVSSPFNSSAGIIDKATISDRLRLLYGDASDTQLTIENTTNNVIPVADSFVIDLSGNTTGIVTDGVDAAYIAAEFGNGTTNTNSGLRINIDPVNTPSGDEVFHAINIEGLAAATSATETAIQIGTNWDNALVVGSTTVVNGSGQVPTTVLSGTLFSITDSTTTEAITQGNTLTFSDGTDINFVVSATDTVTANNTSTLATVTGRGATTTTLVNLNGGYAISPTTTGTFADFDLETEWTSGDLVNADWDSATTQTAALTGINLDFTNLTSVAGSTTYGVLINDLAAQTSSSEYAIYQEGTNWDYGIFAEDAVLFGNSLQLGQNGADGQLILFNDLLMTERQITRY